VPTSHLQVPALSGGIHKLTHPTGSRAPAPAATPPGACHDRRVTLFAFQGHPSAFAHASLAADPTQSMTFNAPPLPSPRAAGCWPSPPPATAFPSARAWRSPWGPAAPAHASSECSLGPLLEQGGEQLAGSIFIAILGRPLGEVPTRRAHPTASVCPPPPLRRRRRPHLHHVSEPQSPSSIRLRPDARFLG